MLKSALRAAIVVPLGFAFSLEVRGRFVSMAQRPSGTAGPTAALARAQRQRRDDDVCGTRAIFY